MGHKSQRVLGVVGPSTANTLGTATTRIAKPTNALQPIKLMGDKTHVSLPIKMEEIQELRQTCRGRIVPAESRKDFHKSNAHHNPVEDRVSIAQGKLHVNPYHPQDTIRIFRNE